MGHFEVRVIGWQTIDDEQTHGCWLIHTVHGHFALSPLQDGSYSKQGERELGSDKKIEEDIQEDNNSGHSADDWVGKGHGGQPLH